MLRFYDTFYDMPIRSLRTGRQIGKLGDHIINPDNLRLDAFYVQQRLSGAQLYLFASDIREIGRLGAVIDSEDSLMEGDDLVRLEKLQEINFLMQGKKVETDKKRKVGKVVNYAVDDASFLIEKMYIRPSIMKGFTSGDLVIGRQQVLNVTDSKIVVKDTDIKAQESARKPSFNPIVNG